MSPQGAPSADMRSFLAETIAPCAHEDLDTRLIPRFLTRHDVSDTRAIGESEGYWRAQEQLLGTLWVVVEIPVRTLFIHTLHLQSFLDSSNSYLVILLSYLVMEGNLKWKNYNAQRGGGNTTKRQRRATRALLVFEQGVNPVPPTPPLTAKKQRHSQRHSQHCQSQRNAHSHGRSSAPAPASQLAIDAQTNDELGIAEDDDVEVEVEEEEDALPEEEGDLSPEEEEDPPPEDVEAAIMVSEHAAGAAGDSPGVAFAVSVASSSQSQRQLAAVTKEVNEEPKLHFRWRACWSAMEKNSIPSASRLRVISTCILLAMGSCGDGRTK
jgi:hypothetical protein